MPWFDRGFCTYISCGFTISAYFMAAAVVTSADVHFRYRLIRNRCGFCYLANGACLWGLCACF